MNRSDTQFHTIQAILKLLFDREELQLHRREMQIVTRNQGLGGSADGFRHLGIIYTSLEGANRKLGNYGRLHSSLVPELDGIISEKATIASDKERIRQALAMSLKDCRSFQDIRDALPNCISELIPECRPLERTREEAYTLLDNPRSYTQYMKLRENMEFYAASRLLY